MKAHPYCEGNGTRKAIYIDEEDWKYLVLQKMERGDKNVAETLGRVLKPLREADKS